MKRLLKWVLRLFLLLVVLAVVAILLINPVMRLVIQNSIRAQTGMDAEIGKFSVGLLSPTITIQDLKLYNTPDFGGTLFLSIPEIHAEYDRDALARRELHVTLLRFNLGELDIVKNQSGQTNIFALAAAPSIKKTGTSSREFTKETGLKFTGIDVLNVSVGKAKYIDLGDQRNDREQTFGIENCVVKNVKSEKDLTPLALFIGLRGGDFFTSLMAPKSSSSELLQLFGK